jgi:predicted DNA-binding transcriptional regulator YafY
MKTAGHEQLAIRLAAILIKLNNGERLDIDELADEFSVSARTIQRDILRLSSFLPIEKQPDGGRYTLDPLWLGRFTRRDLERFAALAGVTGLFPALDETFIRELLDERLRTKDVFSIHAPAREDISRRKAEFVRLQDAIRQKRRISFTYRKTEGNKTVSAAPYRLINHTGVWYLAAADLDAGGAPKAYVFSKIRALNVTEESYQPDPEIVAMLDEEDSVWLKPRKTEAVLKLAPPIAHYFQRRPLIAQQVIVKSLEDGGLIVSGKFAHPNQILPIVRYWLPHVRIISPEGWQEELEAGLRGYLES